ncbi:MAG: pilus assembly protein TadG-related protein [Pseudomonadota bacterium]
MGAFAAARSGNVAMMAAFLLTPLVIAVGVAIDFAARADARAHVQQAADAAALAAMRQQDLYGSSGLNARVDAFVRADLGARVNGLTGFSVNAQPSADAVTVTIEASVKSAFMKIAGVTALDASARATAARGGAAPFDELVFALDLTGSLVWSGVHLDLIDEAADFIAEIGAIPGASSRYVAIVPFTSVVNVGTDKTAWLTSLNAADFAPGSWAGCVFARQTGDLDLTDDAPTAGRWRPYVWRRDYSSTEPYNDWGASPASAFVNGLSAAPAGTPASLSGVATVGTWGPNVGCMAPIRPLTNDHAGTEAYIRAIDSFSFDGGTNLGQAMAWSWRSISPKWRGLWGAAAATGTPSDAGRKAILLLSDGQSKWSDLYFNGPHVTGYGEPGFALPQAENLQNEGNADDRFEDVCARAKADGLTVYTILFANAGGAARRTMENCATSPDHFYLAGDRAALRAAFQGVAGGGTGDLRLIN